MAIRSKSTEVLHAIVGTAGHVDHGKTELVKNLTGCDTDRLPEEKARGMSIDLGFAPYVLPDGRIVGVVDVPGHSDFIRNMVAGAASIDVLMLVVAADDGVMAQTDEHLRIVRLLRTARVMAVVTKIDLVDDGRRAAAEHEVRSLLARTGFADAPVVSMSNRTGEGIDETRAELERLVREAASGAPLPSEAAPAFRMNVERTFVLKGHGTVVTGIPLAGSVALDDRLELLPAGTLTSPRAIQTYKLEAARAAANVCVALNVRHLAADAIRRGMTLATPGVFEATTALLGTVENASEATVIRQRERVRLHAGTSATIASLSLLDVDHLEPGQSAFVRARLEDPVVLATGDRFILRSLTPGSTLGGGAVLSTRVPRMRRNAPALLPALASADRALQRGDRFGASVAASLDTIVTSAALARQTQCAPEAAELLIKAKQDDGTLIPLGDDFLVAERVGDFAQRVKRILQSHHAASPLAWGMSSSHACSVLGVGPANFRGWGEALSRVDPEIVVRHGTLGLASHRPALTDEQQRLRHEIVKCVQAAGIAPPARGDLRAALGIPAAALNLFLRLLADEEQVMPLHAHVVSRAVFETCRERLVALGRGGTVIDLSAFRAATGVSRRVAVDLLEAFDVQGLTRRVPAGRVLAKPE